jgi:hypothetical protein
MGGAMAMTGLTINWSKLLIGASHQLEQVII